MQQFPEITTLHHVALVVDDLEQACDFYRDDFTSGFRWLFGLFDIGHHAPRFSLSPFP
jgi:catechol 2,3-dioxygenase-like lactoylglutathione lyase family enzyme